MSSRLFVWSFQWMRIGIDTGSAVCLEIRYVHNFTITIFSRAKGWKDTTSSRPFVWSFQEMRIGIDIGSAICQEIRYVHNFLL